MFRQTASLASFALAALALPGVALGYEFQIDFDSARIAGSSCLEGENAFLSRAGNNAVNLELGDFGVTVGALGAGATARETCTLALPGRLPRGFTIALVRSQGSYDVVKSSSPDARLAMSIAGAGLRADPAMLVFPSGRSAFANRAAFSLTNEITDDGVLCNPNRSEDVTLAVSYAVSAVKGAAQSYAELGFSPGREVRVSIDVRRCR
jgi:hypothetical protein